MLVFESLLAKGAASPAAIALVMARGGRSIDFGTLAALSRRAANGFAQRGIVPGDRVLLMIRPGIEFVAAGFGLLMLGAVPVFVDPGMGRTLLFGCIADATPAGMVAVRLLHLARLLLPRPFQTVRVAVSHGFWPGASRLASVLATEGDAPLAAALAGRARAPSPDDTALVAFTSGSTGSPKGVAYTHRTLAAIVEAVRAMGSVREGDAQLAVLPFMALLGPGIGCKTVFPEMSASRPVQSDPALLTDAIVRHGVTHAFGSPTLWEHVGAHCARAGQRLPSMRCLLLAGAPVPPALLTRWRAILEPGASVQVCYGATEAFPLASLDAAEALAIGADGRGFPVGRAVPGIETRIAPIVPESASGFLATGEIGEIVVRGPVVAPSYFARPEADTRARFADPAGGAPWYRTGDAGLLDSEGRLWFQGRIAERIETATGPLFTARIEPAFGKHPGVRRVAVVARGAAPAQIPVLVVEPTKEAWPASGTRRAAFTAELLALSPVPAIREVYFRRALPLDIRHRAKILRLELARSIV